MRTKTTHPVLKESLVDVCETLLQCYEAGEYDLLRRIVTGKEHINPSQ